MFAQCHIRRQFQVLRLCALALALVFLGYATHALAAPELGSDAQPVPALKGWVNDIAGVLTVAERQRLSDLLAKYHLEIHHQLVVLIIPALPGERLETYALRVFNAWGLGYKGLDNGILVMLTMKERQVRIELGKGMERYISDAQAEAIIQEMVPAFKRGDFAGGLEKGLERLMSEARRYVVNSSDLPAS
jgi:uncharacterized protein